MLHGNIFMNVVSVIIRINNYTVQKSICYARMLPASELSNALFTLRASGSSEESIGN